MVGRLALGAPSDRARDRHGTVVRVCQEALGIPTHVYRRQPHNLRESVNKNTLYISCPEPNKAFKYSKETFTHSQRKRNFLIVLRLGAAACRKTGLFLFCDSFGKEGSTGTDTRFVRYGPDFGSDLRRGSGLFRDFGRG
jgi:hypothetical protein